MLLTSTASDASSAGVSSVVFSVGVSGFVCVLPPGRNTLTLGVHPKMNTSSVRSSSLFPFNRSRRFRTNIIYNPVYPFYVINDLIGYLCQKLIRQMYPVCSHTIQ